MDDSMKLEIASVKRELEAMQKMKREFEELRSKHAKLQTENEEVRRIVGDMYVSVDEDRDIRESYQKLYAEIMDSINTPYPKTGDLMPKIYDRMVSCRRHSKPRPRPVYILPRVLSHSRASRATPPTVHRHYDASPQENCH